MINIISFPDFGCGGLFCTLFNETTIEWNNNFPNTLMNYEHNGLKIGANYMNNCNMKIVIGLRRLIIVKENFQENFVAHTFH